MPTLRIALAQVNPTVGDLSGNARLVRDFTRAAVDAGGQLIVFPEMMLTGYPVEDLVFRESFVAAARAGVRQLAADLDADGFGEVPVLVGYLDADGPAAISSEADPGRGPRNALAVLHRGAVVATYFKHHLPNYGVFDEDRYFVPGTALTVVRVGGVDVALTICEDLWQAGGPFTAARRAGVGLVVTVNGSPYELDKDDARLPLVRRRAAEAGATVAYVNLVGGQDELVFDGDSMIVAADGTLLARAPQFVEHLLLHDLELPAADAPVADASAADGYGEDGMGIDRVVVSESPAAPAGEPATGGQAEPLPAEAEIWSALVAPGRAAAGARRTAVPGRARCRRRQRSSSRRRRPARPGRRPG